MSNNAIIITCLCLLSLMLGLILGALTQNNFTPKGMPDGEHIAAPGNNGLSVTIDGENGMICYRERYNSSIDTNCHPFQEH